jgi:aryl-alcohol dehydrogenase-like predicted oxidoreductase
MMQSEGVGLMVWSPLAGGLLSGKYDRDGQSAEGGRRQAFDFPPVNKDRAFDCIDVMRVIAKAKVFRSRRLLWPGCCISRRSAA